MNGLSQPCVDWGLYRYFLAVAKTSSLTAAARSLGVSQPTVGRQIHALETSLNAKLFDRTKDGCALTDAGRAIVEQVEAIEEQTLAIERHTAGESARPTGRVRISAAEGLATFWLAPKLPAFNRLYPDIEIDLAVGSAPLDMMRREADIVLRIGTPVAEDLICKRICPVGFGLYASDGYLAEHGMPQCLDDLSGHKLIESTGEIDNLAQAKELRRLLKRRVVAVQCNNILTQFAALQAGAGMLALPFYMAESVSGLRRVLADQFHLSLDLWLLVHRDLRLVARIDLALDYLAQEIRKDAERLSGQELH